MAALSLMTVLWLSAELYAKLTVRASGWPITAFAMFSDPQTHAVSYKLVGVGHSRRTLTATDFGLSASNPLYVYLVTNVVDRLDGATPSVRVNGRKALARLLEIYNREHRQDPLSRISVYGKVTSLRSSSQTATRRIVTAP